jgi:DNA-binding response OmpR family regulator
MRVGASINGLAAQRGAGPDQGFGLPGRETGPDVRIEVGEGLVGSRDGYERLRALLDQGTIVILAPSIAAVRQVLAEFAPNGNAGPTDTMDGPCLVGDDLSIEFRSRRVTTHGQELRLSTSEYRILAVLASDVGRARAFSELVGARERDSMPSSSDSVRSAVKRLRRKLAGAGTHVVIEAVSGFGFRLMNKASP